MVDSVTTENAHRTRRLQVRNTILRGLKQPATAMGGCVQSDASRDALWRVSGPGTVTTERGHSSEGDTLTVLGMIKLPKNH